MSNHLIRIQCGKIRVQNGKIQALTPCLPVGYTENHAENAENTMQSDGFMMRCGGCVVRYIGFMFDCDGL